MISFNISMVLPIMHTRGDTEPNVARKILRSLSDEKTGKDLVGDSEE
jgi:hypothetical protein